MSYYLYHGESLESSSLDQAGTIKDYKHLPFLFRLTSIMAETKGILALPFEISQQIFQYLEANDVWGLALASKAASRLTDPCIFRNVVLSYKPGARNNLKERITELEGILTKRQCVDAVRSLRTVTELRFVDPWPQYIGPLESRAWKRMRPIVRRWDLKRRVEILEDEQLWQPFSEFMGRLSSLRLLEWGCSQQIPPCVLQTVQALEHCELHITTFALNVRADDWAENKSVHQHEVAVVNCPKVTAVSYQVGVAHHGAYGAKMNEWALLGLVAGLAPNLREVSVWMRAWGGSYLHVARASIFERPGLDYYYVCGNVPSTSRMYGNDHLVMDRTSSTPPRGRLTSLEVRRARHNVEQVDTMLSLLESFNIVTDFSLLRRLSLLCCLGVGELRWLTENVQLSSLDELALGILSRAGYVPGALSEETTKFLLSVPPLTELRLICPFDNTMLESIFDHHGETLRRLCLEASTGVPRTDRKTIELLVAKCPNLTTLAIPFFHEPNDEAELAVVGPLGEVTSLEHVHVGMYASMFKNASWQEAQGPNISLSDGVDFQPRHLLSSRLKITEKMVTDMSRLISNAKPKEAKKFMQLDVRDMTKHEVSPDIDVPERPVHSWTCIAKGDGWQVFPFVQGRGRVGGPPQRRTGQ